MRVLAVVATYSFIACATYEAPVSGSAELRRVSPTQLQAGDRVAPNTADGLVALTREVPAAYEHARVARTAHRRAAAFGWSQLGLMVTGTACTIPDWGTRDSGPATIVGVSIVGLSIVAGILAVTFSVRADHESDAAIDTYNDAVRRVGAPTPPKTASPAHATVLRDWERAAWQRR